MNHTTKFTIVVSDESRATISLIFWQGEPFNAKVNWGDGSEPDVFEAEELVRAKHQYTSAGTYVIELLSEEGFVLRFGDGVLHNWMSGENDGFRQMLISAEIGDNVRAIENYAFKGCGNLKELSLPQNLEHIGKYAFDGCYSLESIVFPEYIAVLYSGTFFNCVSLKHIELPLGMAEIGHHAFYNCCALEEIDLEGVEEIESSAFQSCRNLNKVNLSTKLRYIGDYAFEGCSALQTALIPQGTKAIGRQAFANCYAVTRIEIPTSVNSIGAGAFAGCSFAKEVRLLNPKPPVLACPSAFNPLASDCTFTIPEGAKEAYESATNWIVFKEKMVEVSEE